MGMKRLTALLLALVMALSLSACTRNDTKKLAGTWTYSADVTEQMNEAVRDALELDEVSPDASVSVYLTFTVDRDGSYTLALDEERLEADRAAYLEALRPVLVQAIYAQAEADGYTKEQYDRALESLGMTAAEAAEAILGALDLDTFLMLLRGGYGDSIISSGYCKAEDGRLYFSGSESFDGADFAAYVLAGDGMKWTDEGGAVTALLSETEQGLVRFPMEWTREKQ